MNLNPPHPLRVQRSRRKGSRLPPGTICVTRPGLMGNPFTPQRLRELGYVGTLDELRDACVVAYRTWLGPNWRTVWDGPESASRRERVLSRLPTLRGVPLACWCSLCRNCHADVIAELANGEK